MNLLYQAGGSSPRVATGRGRERRHPVPLPARSKRPGNPYEAPQALTTAGPQGSTIPEPGIVLAQGGPGCISDDQLVQEGHSLPVPGRGSTQGPPGKGWL